MKRQCAQVFRQPVLRGLHQRAMEGSADGKHDGAFGPAVLCQFGCALDRRFVAGYHRLVGRVQVRRLADFSLHSARMAAMAPTPTGTASCMYLPRLRTVRTASVNDRVPAPTCAEYSPRLCPAT